MPSTQFPRFSKAAYNSRLGLAVMAQQSAAVNEQMVTAVMLPEDQAQKVADAVIGALEAMTERNPNA